MLDMTWVRDHLDEVEKALVNRGGAFDVAEVRRLDAERRAALREVEALKARRNAVSGDIARLKKDKQDAQALIDEMRGAGDRIKDLDVRVAAADEALQALLLNVPNIPDASVPVGSTSDQNVEVRRRGVVPKFDFEPKPHWDIGSALGILDFERAAKMSGARFSVLMGAGARLESREGAP